MRQINQKMVMKNRLGLHMRLAAEVSRIAHQFDSEIKIIKSNEVASTRSIFDLLILGVKRGDVLKLSAVGHDAREALNAVHGFLSTYRDVEVGYSPCEDREPASSVA